ncbi:lipopolysaccharide biosynthesis protein [Planosporangium sp. 12N6]|uniref:lipopolysaccharide biosynthesis protein n=1 Tax=Planosporangium spinosum TaxID=3402278 RepID=UPI003CE70E1E
MKGTIRQIAGTAATRLACMVLGAVTGVVVARALHPEGRGAFAVVMTLATITLSVGHLSVEQAQMALWRDARAMIPANAALLGPVVGGFAALTAAAVVAVLGRDVVPLSSVTLTGVALLSAPFGMTVLYLNSVLVLQARVDVVNRSLLITTLLQVAVLLGCAFTGTLTVAVAIWVWSVSVGFPLVVLIPAIRPRLRDRNLGFARRTVLFGLRYHAGFAALFLLMRLDVLILNALSDAMAVGLYAAAVTVAEMSRILTDAAAQVATSRQAGGELTDAAVVTARATRLSTLLACAAVGGVCVVAPLAVPLLYGEAFRGSVAALFALAPGMFALGATRALGVYLLRLDRPVRMTAITVVAVAANILLCLVLIPRWGIVGCALASSACYVAVAGCQVAWFVRATGVPLTGLLPGRAEIVRLRRTVAARSGSTGD